MKAVLSNISPARVLFTRLMRRLGRAPYFGPLSTVYLRDIPPPPSPGSGQVRIRNRIAGICGSDLHFVLGEGDLRIAPAAVLAAIPGGRYAYMGHEIVGDVTDVGPGVTRFKVGDRVVQEKGGHSCLAQGHQPPCRQCATGNYNLCEAPVEEMHDGTVGGGWSEEWVTTEGRLFPVPDDLTDEQAVLIEPIGSGLRAVTRRTPQPGEKVLIIGQGTQGLGTLLSIRALQPDCRVTVLARFPYQADMSRRLGADEVIMLGSDLYQEAARLTGGKVYQGMFGNRTLLGGFDVVYDCVGIPSTLKDALRLARAGGTVVLVGVYLEPMKIDLTPVWYWEVDLIGVLAHGAEDWQGERVGTYDLIARLMREGKMNVDGLITHRFTLPQWRQAIATAIQQPRTHSIKVVFDYRQ
jgi:2-desacetyl-2-hydroxyethyl bacteriochlorophyllide A dehydrogenase